MWISWISCVCIYGKLWVPTLIHTIATRLISENQIIQWNFEQKKTLRLVDVSTFCSVFVAKSLIPLPKLDSFDLLWILTWIPDRRIFVDKSACYVIWKLIVISLKTQCIRRVCVYVCVCICVIMNKRQLLIMYTDWAICCQGRLSDMSDRGSLPVLQQ